MSASLRMRVACDTPLGVEFTTLEAKGKGLLIVERIVEAFAKARGWKPDECEPLTIVDEDTQRLMWTHNDHAPLGA